MALGIAIGTAFGIANIINMAAYWTVRIIIGGLLTAAGMAIESACKGDF